MQALVTKKQIRSYFLIYIEENLEKSQSAYESLR